LVTFHLPHNRGVKQSTALTYNTVLVRGRKIILSGNWKVS